MTFLQQQAISGALFTQVKKRGLGKKTSRPVDTKKTAEIRRFPDFRFRAIDEARTRDLHLGKVAYYQLYYYRIYTCPRIAATDK